MGYLNFFFFEFYTDHYFGFPFTPLFYLLGSFCFNSFLQEGAETRFGQCFGPGTPYASLCKWERMLSHCRKTCSMELRQEWSFEGKTQEYWALEAEGNRGNSLKPGSGIQWTLFKTKTHFCPIPMFFQCICLIFLWLALSFWVKGNLSHQLDVKYYFFLSHKSESKDCCHHFC